MAYRLPADLAVPIRTRLARDWRGSGGPALDESRYLVVVIHPAFSEHPPRAALHAFYSDDTLLSQGVQYRGRQRIGAEDLHGFALGDVLCSEDPLNYGGDPA